MRFLSRGERPSPEVVATCPKRCRRGHHRVRRFLTRPLLLEHPDGAVIPTGHLPAEDRAVERGLRASRSLDRDLRLRQGPRDASNDQPVHIAAAIAETSLFTFICVPPRVVVVCPRESTGDREARFLTALRPGQTKVRPFLSVSKRGPPLPALGLGEPAIVAGGRARKRPLVALAAGPARLIPANLNLGWVIKRERLASRNRHRAPGGRVVVDGAHPPR